MQLDTYEREVERYGGPHAIELAERIFAADSDAALAVVRDLPGDRGAELRWRVALRGIDLLFDDLGLPLDERRAVARRAREGYGRELGVDGAFRREVGRRYRQERPALEQLLEPGQRPAPELTTSVEALRRRSAVIAPVCAAIVSLAEDGALTTELPDLAMSLAHMHVNRLLRSAHRAQELVLYEMLDRAYSSRAARCTP
jgi:thiopeptide-type bacteriocin biosynthesis protein